MLSAGADGRVLRWRKAEPDHVRLLATLPDPLYTAWLQKGAAHLYAGTTRGELFVLDMRAKAERQHILAHNSPIYCMNGTTDGLLYVGGGDGVLTVWSMGSDALLHAVRRVPIAEAKLRSIAIQRGLIALAFGDGSVHVLNEGTLNTIAHWTAHELGCSTVAWHPSKPVLLSGGKDGQLAAWKVDNDFEPILRLPAHRSTIYAIGFSADADWLATASRDKTVKLWNPSTLDPVARLDVRSNGHTHSVNALCWGADGLYSGGDDRALLRWPLPTPGPQISGGLA
ncbi:MAG: hypothetical protein IPM46_05450 [Flavobacteriales bacterium]|nr:hypothetical protein [Flavobacteriales bacterium]